MEPTKDNFLENQGKIKISLLIAAIVVIVLFASILWIKHDYFGHTVAAAIPGAAILATSSTSSSVTTATSTVSQKVESVVTAIFNPPVNVPHSVGIAAGGGLSKLDTADMNQELDEMNDLGITWVRFDIEWGDVQYSSPTDSNWYAYDTLVDAIAAHHMKALVILLFTPQWARDPSCTGGAKCPPANPAQFATFASEVATRYKGEVQAYEVWNEPNNYAFWATKTDCNAYTALLKATYPAIKKADSSAIVITGGLAPEATDSNNISPTDFLTCVYKDGGEGYFDAVGDHPYTFPALPSSSNANAWAQMSETSPSLRSIMVANGDADKQIWITEYGTPTDGPDPNWFVTETQQANMVTDAFNLYKTYPWAGPLFWYSLKDDGTSTSTQENFFGLIRADNSLKPAFQTLQKIIAAGV